MLDQRSAWESIGSLYALPGVQQACLALQENLGLSVTTLLTLLWAARQDSGALTDRAARHLARRTEHYQETVLRPMRRARRGVKEWDAALGEAGLALRAALLENELEAERMEQQLVLELLGPEQHREPADDPCGDACLTVARYLAGLAATPDNSCLQQLAYVMSAVLEDYDGLHIARVLDRAIDA
ncbi:MAG: TIGR02444 family protein [Ectothiorhodospiraceae bacterium]|nr:TIGR02444 family protein [Ectothiorhodospiraceae bacterium]MCH8506183.1 TIGR02444 family protein [Ectothiorhodospiraceae bacterium]